MIRFLAWLFVFFGTSLNVLAETEIGNGGDVVICVLSGDAQEKTYELLDSYEARVLRNFEIDLGTTESYLDRALFAIERLKTLDPRRYQTYKSRAEEFSTRIRFVNDSLQDIPDHGELDLDSTCTIEQIAIQQEGEFPEDKLYKINRHLWDKLDVDSQAILLLHEVIFWDALQRGHQDSRKARYFVGLLASNAFENLDDEGYQDRLFYSRLGMFQFYREAYDVYSVSTTDFRRRDYRMNYIFIDVKMNINEASDACKSIDPSAIIYTPTYSHVAIRDNTFEFIDNNFTNIFVQFPAFYVWKKDTYGPGHGRRYDDGISYLKFKLKTRFLESWVHTKRGTWEENGTDFLKNSELPAFIICKFKKFI